VAGDIAFTAEVAKASVNTDAFMQSALCMADLLALCQSPWGLESYSPLREHNYLLLHLANGSAPYRDPQLAQLANRLRQLPCPVIAVGEVAPPELLRGIDVLVATPDEAAMLVHNIDAYPLAAMTLVQLLRHNEDVTPEQGLFAESLAYASLQAGGEFAQAMKIARPSTPIVDRCDNDLRIVLNRPRARNAYSSAMRDSLYEALQLLQLDKGLRRAVVRGEGACFCIGGDLQEFGTVPDVSTAHAIRSTRCVAQLLLELHTRLEFHLHSACIGAGIELPAFAARVVADKSTFMQLPEIKLGLLPGAGGTVSITRRIGRHRTAYLALSARRITASTALQWGLIDAII
jgi:enoyl-CoA hydratase